MEKPPRITDFQKDHICKLYHEGHSLEEISKSFSITCGEVEGILQEAIYGDDIEIT